MNDEREMNIDVPKSYGSNPDNSQSIPDENVIYKIPYSTNKVRKKIIRGVLKGDVSSSNE